MFSWGMGAAAGRSGALRTRAGIPTTVEVTPPPRRPVPSFLRLVARSTPVGATVLNVGGGCNASGPLPGVRRRAGRIVAVDPAPRVHHDAVADERHQLTLEQYAVDHPDSCDVAFAVFVLEHVTDPEAFTAAAARVLRAGGTFLALTPHLSHWFGLTTWAASRVGVEDVLLRMVREPAAVTEYHVPTAYRLNSAHALARHLGPAGFASLHVTAWDQPRLYAPYLPGPARGLAGAWHRGAYAVGRPALMSHLVVRAAR